MISDDDTTRVLPQFFPKHWLDTADIVSNDFPSRIRIGYVLREGGAYSFLLAHDIADSGTMLEQLHTAAITNLAKLPSASITIGKVTGGSEGWISATDDNFAAVRILLPEVQSEFATELGNEFLLTLTNRDDCFCWSLAQSRERQQRHLERALEDFLSDDYNLTPDVLLFSNGRFRLYREQRVD